MAQLGQLTTDEAREELRAQRARLDEFKAQNLKLNMARGKPSKQQLDLSMDMLTIISKEEDVYSAAGDDCRNYGIGAGLPEAKQLLSSMLDDTPENIVVCGNASLNIMYDTVMRCMMFGPVDGEAWSKLDQVKWLCPVPGYDRHFGVTEAFGIEMINIPMTDEGPDMDEVERLVSEDAAIKGIWCVPVYSNPGGVTYSDEVVERLAGMHTAAEDFKIFWDNAYCVHHLFDNESDQDHVKDIRVACELAGHPNRAFKFASTSKITFPGAGISGFASSAENVAWMTKLMGQQTIGHDKLNQLRHVKFLKDADGIRAHMAKHAAILRPKFACVTDTLKSELTGWGCTWSNPRGGYFVCFEGPDNTATRIVELARETGVVMTGAGAPFPYKRDPFDSVIRIAPTLPPLEELEVAMQVFVTCAKIAILEEVLANEA